MYSWIDGRKFSYSKSLPTSCLTSRQFNPFIKSGFELSSFNHLPVIKEEDGCTSDDEVEFSQGVLQNSLKKKSYARESSSYVSDWSAHSKSLQRVQDSKSITKLPPLLNINCLMNTEMKHTQAVWNTNFGKRLLLGKNFDENVYLSDTKEFPPNDKIINTNKFGDCQPCQSLTKRKSIQGKNFKNGGGEKFDFSQLKSIKKKSKKIKKNSQNLSTKQSNQEIKYIEKISEPQLSEKFFETSSKESLEEIQTVSSFSKKQRFLTECVKSILDCYSTQIACEHCKERLQNIEEFQTHKKQHEAEKEICLLCDKVFYDSNKFIQHLLTHEGVDRFSCKKCKKYFPNLKKYKQHCQNFHAADCENASSKNIQNLELVEKWLPKFECKRCKIEFNSEKAQDDHRRDHVKKDLVSAYLLTPRNV